MNHSQGTLSDNPLQVLASRVHDVKSGVASWSLFSMLKNRSFVGELKRRGTLVLDLIGGNSGTPSV